MKGKEVLGRLLVQRAVAGDLPIRCCVLIAP